MRLAPLIIIGSVVLGLGACQSKPPAKLAAAQVDQAKGNIAGSVTPPAAAVTTPTADRPVSLLPGSGKLLGDNLATAPAPSTGPLGIQFSFNDANISEVVGTVLGDGLGLTYSIDPQVKGTMSLQSSAPLAREQVLPALEDALELQGYGIVVSGNLYRIVPLKEAQHAGASLRLPMTSGGAGYAIQIVPLHYIGAEEMEKILEPFAASNGIVRVDEARNLVELAGTSAQLSRLLDVVHTFDVDWLAGMSFAIYPLSYVDAKTLTSELGEIFTDERSPLAGVVRLIPIARLNSILAITPEAHYLAQVDQWIKRLDLGGSTSGRRIYVYDVQNGRAEDLAKSLNEILSLSSSNSSTDNTSGARQPGAAGSTMSTGIGSSMSTGTGITSGIGTNIASGIGTLSGVGASAGTSALRGSPPASGPANNFTATNPTSARSSNSNFTNGLEGSLRIVTDQSSNALLILATPSEFSVIQSALTRLDQAPRQVLIEASIAEVTLTDDLQFGLQWSDTAHKGVATLSTASNGAVSQSFPGFSYLYTGSSSISAVLNTIQTHTTVRVLSSPKLIVLNNHPATLDVGDEVPVITQTAVSTDTSSAPIVNAVQMTNTGVILQVVPHVNKNGLVILDITQEVSDSIPTTTSSINSPTIEERNLSTTVAVNSGDTIALGGLISSSHTQTRSGFPILSRIPVLGALFGTTDNNGQRTELIMLLTPRVLESSADLDAASNELRDEFKLLKQDFPAKSAH